MRGEIMFLDKIKEIAAAVKDVAPTIYEDAIQPTAKETGELISLPIAAVNAALTPLKIWIMKKEFNIEATRKLLAKKLQSIDEDKIVTPEAYVAVPALQSLAYSMDSEELRDLYANLLASAMNIDKKDMVHPTLVDVIKQMSPLDARVFRELMNSEIKPLMSIEIKSSNTNGMTTIYPNVTHINIDTIENISISLCNLQKCGLINLDFYHWYTKDDNYNIIKNSEHYKKAISNIPADVLTNLKGCVEITDLGKLFSSICL